MTSVCTQTVKLFRQLTPKGIFADISRFLYENYITLQHRLLTFGKEATQYLEITRIRCDIIVRDVLPVTLAKIIIKKMERVTFSSATTA